MKRFLADWMPEFSKPESLVVASLTQDINGNGTVQTKPYATFQAVVFRQGPNRNHFRFDDSELQDFAGSFKGQPFLADHGRELNDRGGTILESRLEERGGVPSIVQTIRAVKPWAIEGLQDGTVDRFSIGWNAEEYICTVCNEDILGDDCKHTPWDVGSKDKKSGKTIEILMRGLEGVETSAVVRPAVPGTGIEAIARQLSEQGISGSGKRRPTVNSKESEMFEKILAVLGLPSDTDEETAVKTLSDRIRPRVPTAILKALGLGEDATEDQTIAKVVGMTAPGAFVPKADHDKILSELSAIKADRTIKEAIAAGKLTPSNETWAREFAQRDPASFAAFLAHKPIETPVAADRPNVRDEAGTVLSDEERLVIARCGLTEKEFLESKARAN